MSVVHPAVVAIVCGAVLLFAAGATGQMRLLTMPASWVNPLDSDIGKHLSAPFELPHAGPGRDRWRTTLVSDGWQFAYTGR